MLIYLVLFFKQKTAYEVRISDWSSDVCSSDLTGGYLVHGCIAKLNVLLKSLHSRRHKSEQSFKFTLQEMACRHSSFTCRGGGRDFGRVCTAHHERSGAR